MRLRLTLLLYNLLLPFALLILLPKSLLKMRRRGGSGAGFWQRFGFFDEDVNARLTAGAGRTWWIHAVSVGEVGVAQKLIAEIRRREPDRPLVLSVTTPTGWAVAVKEAPQGLTVIYSPLDFGWIVRAVLRRIRPERYILMEAEVWPNLVRRAQKHGIPVTLANARLSPRSERRFRRFRFLAAPLFSMLDRVLVQEEGDIARWTGIGVPPERIRVTGSIKYDLTGGANAERVEEFRALLRGLWEDPLPPLLLAASTHPGEEKVLAQVFMELRREYPTLVFLVVPRHFERRADVAAELQSLGMKVAQRSRLAERGVALRSNDEGLMDAAECNSALPLPDALIIDSTGELRDWQALATVVVIGKSFLAEGGQNPAEAIAAGVPVITGPHMENFQPLMELLRKADGIVQVDSLAALLPALREAFANPDNSRAAAARGRAALELHRGATARTLDEIVEQQRTVARASCPRTEA